MKKIILYKYCKLPSPEYWNSMLTTIKFTKLSNLNDPFEGFLRARDDSGIIIKKIPTNTFISSFSRVSPFTPIKKNEKSLQHNVYMWSHYADSMNGICLEYSFIPPSAASKLFESKEVQYKTTFKTSDIHPYTKYKSWKFESEYRLKLKKETSESVEIYKEAKEYSLTLTSIYAGVRLIGKNQRYGKEKIREKMSLHPFIIYLKKLHPDITINICVRHHNSFKITKLKNPI